MKKSRTERIPRRNWIIAVFFLVFAAIAFTGAGPLTERQAHIAPQYRRENIEPLLSEALEAGGDGLGGGGNEELTEEEYDFIYHQTGLGRPAVETLLDEDGGIEEILQIQDIFFADIRYQCIRDHWVAHREQTVDENGAVVQTMELAGVEDGDILITKSSHVAGWRNGHAALVIDAENRKTLEAIVIGKNTGVRRFSKWERYPNFLVLRLSGADRRTRASAARWAQQHLMDIPYRLTTGFFGTKDMVSGTQCAHLIWRAYEEIGYDLDENGGWIVTPRQLANSSLLEIVQVYGMDPDDPWP